MISLNRTSEATAGPSIKSEDGVAIGGDSGVLVAVAVGLGVAVGVNVGVSVSVGVGEGGSVGKGSGVLVVVGLGVSVGVGISVSVGVGEGGSGVGVGGAQGFDGEPLLRGVGSELSKSALLLLLSVQPPSKRCNASLLEPAGAG